MSISFSFDEKNISVVLDETNLQISNLEQNVQVNLENQFKIEDLSDKTLVKILMLKGEKGDTGATTGASWGYITGNITDQTDLKNALNSKVNATDLSTVATSGSYNDLTNKPTIPSKTSDLTNDSGFITSYTETDPVFTNSVAHEITSTDITNWNNKSTFSGNYNDLTNKPTIPDELSDLSDDSTHRLVTDTEKSTWNAKSDFSGSYTDLSNKPTIPTKTSDLTNDSGFITSYTETDPIFSASASAGITSTDINNWNSKPTPADYVIQTGTETVSSITWTYTKWNSGKIELFGSNQNTGLRLTTASAGTYYGAGNDGVRSVTLPFTFDTILFVGYREIDLRSSGIYVYDVSVSSTTLTTQFRAHASSSNVHCGVNYYIIGTITQ